MTGKLPGVILAAGRSTRMGRDKALLPVGDSNFINTLAATFLELLDPVVVVLGHHAEKIRSSLDERVQVTVNEDYDRGMLSSLQTGLRAIPEDAPAAVFTLVDHPHLRSETLRTLLEHYDGEPLAIPRYQGKRGHPVMVRRDVIEELLALDPDGSPKPVIRAHYPNALFLDLPDPAVTEDIDTPEDYSRNSQV